MAYQVSDIAEDERLPSMKKSTLKQYTRVIAKLADLQMPEHIRVLEKLRGKKMSTDEKAILFLGDVQGFYRRELLRISVEAELAGQVVSA